LEAFILTDITFEKCINYINISVDTISAGFVAPEAKLELRLPYKQGPDRHPGSIPGWGAALFD
jgi:hypothetical protein